MDYIVKGGIFTPQYDECEGVNACTSDLCTGYCSVDLPDTCGTLGYCGTLTCGDLGCFIKG
jgi:hypothetical protein